MIARHFLPLIIALTSTAPLHAQSAADPTELARLEAAIARTTRELAGMRGERGSIAADIESREQTIHDAQQGVAGARADIAQLQQEGSALQQRQVALEAQRDEQRKQIASYVRQAWAAGNEEQLKLLLSQQDPLQSARLLRYYRYFSDARSQRIAEFDSTLVELNQVAQQLAATGAALQERERTLEEQLATLADEQSGRAALLARLDADVAERERELDRLERERAELQLLVSELRDFTEDLELGDDLEPFAARKGRLPWPASGSIVHQYGERHALGDLVWEGVTIGVASGTSVGAIHSGRVVFADWFGASGLLLIIDHGDGYMSLYAHNQELYKAVGDWVAGGETVAAAGNTGGQRDPGVYFEIRRNGSAENPVDWCVPHRVTP